MITEYRVGLSPAERAGSLHAQIEGCTLIKLVVIKKPLTHFTHLGSCSQRATSLGLAVLANPNESRGLRTIHACGFFFFFFCIIKASFSRFI